MMEDAIGTVSPSATNEAKSVASPMAGSADNGTSLSQTNTQVAGVDEPDMVKTEGDRMYFYNEKEHAVFIMKADSKGNTSILKRIKIPQTYANVDLLINNNKLVILATIYPNFSPKMGFRSYFGSSRSVVATYDVTDTNSLKLERYFQVEGNVSQSRMIGRYAYIITQTSFYVPYYYYDSVISSPTLSASNLIPKFAEARRVASTSDSKKATYKVEKDNVANCNDVEYILPDEATAEKYSLSPSFSVLSVIDTQDSSVAIKKKVFFGDTSDIYMSTKALFLTSHVYTTQSFGCPAGAYCIMPYFARGEHTLVHKIQIDGTDLSYKYSTLLPGSPLTQYAMDENDKEEFRIITRSWSPTSATHLYVLDKAGKMIGSLENIAPNENFQSSRFIGDRLYLVTYQQIDPLFVIDVSNGSSPKVMGELKIPGYSTYLHPYDETHLIGIGRDTESTDNGGERVKGIKIDLYDVADVAHPKQMYTYSLGDRGSDSEALTNPRTFVWYADKKVLFLPATLYTAKDKTSYDFSDVWQGVVGLKIDKTSGIKEVGRVTHMDWKDAEASRQKECATYAQKAQAAPKCRTIIGGGEYCAPAEYVYIPNYCYSDSTVGTYKVSQVWNKSDEFILRSVYTSNVLYTLSQSKIQSSNIDSLATPIITQSFK